MEVTIIIAHGHSSKIIDVREVVVEGLRYAPERLATGLGTEPNHVYMLRREGDAMVVKDVAQLTTQDADRVWNEVYKLEVVRR